MFVCSVDDTILAVASPEGAAAEAILRISGPESWNIAVQHFLFDDRTDKTECLGKKGDQPAVFQGNFVVWKNVAPAPCLLYFWPNGYGYTGQEAVELHLPGSPPLVHAAIAALLESPQTVQTVSGRVRLAEAGEFTLRAFLAGRVDLVQAEAVLGVIDATDRQSMETALGQLAGGIGRPLHTARDALLEILAHLEAGIDFADEGISFISPSELRVRCEEIARVLEETHERIGTQNAHGREPTVVLIGRPNAGKSSLFNRFLDRQSAHPSAYPSDLPADSEGAIVSATPGTTRDYLEAVLERDGVRFRLIDTAGLGMEPDTEPDRIAQSLTQTVLEQADLRLLCVEKSQAELDPWERDVLNRFPKTTLCVRTKTDRVPFANEAVLSFSECATSARTGEGLAELFVRIRTFLLGRNRTGEIVPATAFRCENDLTEALAAIRRALALLADGGEMDEAILAVELRTALERLGAILGEVYTEDILERIFSRFCIGK